MNKNFVSTVQSVDPTETAFPEAKCYCAHVELGAPQKSSRHLAQACIAVRLLSGISLGSDFAWYIFSMALQRKRFFESDDEIPLFWPPRSLFRDLPMLVS